MITFVKLAAISQHVCVRLHWLEGIFLSLRSACPFFCLCKAPILFKMLVATYTAQINMPEKWKTDIQKKKGGVLCVNTAGVLKGPFTSSGPFELTSTVHIRVCQVWHCYVPWEELTSQTPFALAGATLPAGKWTSIAHTYILRRRS